MGKEAQDARDFNVPVEDHELGIRYEKYKRILAGLTIMSDIFMRNVLKKQECTEYILQIIMDKQNLQVKEQICRRITRICREDQLFLTALFVIWRRNGIM